MTGGSRRSASGKALRVGCVILQHGLDLRRLGQIDRRGQHLQDGAPAALDALASGCAPPSLADLRHAGRRQHAGAFHLHHADAAQGVGGAGFVIADGGDIDAQLPGRLAGWWCPAGTLTACPSIEMVMLFIQVKFHVVIGAGMDRICQDRL